MVGMFLQWDQHVLLGQVEELNVFWKPCVLQGFLAFNISVLALFRGRVFSRAQAITCSLSAGLPFPDCFFIKFCVWGLVSNIIVFIWMSALKHIFECAHHSSRNSLLDKGIYPKFKKCLLKPAVLKKKEKKSVPGARDTGRKRSALSLGRSQSGEEKRKTSQKMVLQGCCQWGM